MGDLNSVIDVEQFTFGVGGDINLTPSIETFAIYGSGDINLPISIETFASRSGGSIDLTDEIFSIAVTGQNGGNLALSLSIEDITLTGTIHTVGWFINDDLNLVIDLTHGGQVALQDLDIVLNAIGSTASTGKFEGIIYPEKISITGIDETFGNFAGVIDVEVLTISGHSSTKGSFAGTVSLETILILSTLYDCVVMNADNTAISEYSNFDFNFIERYGETVYVADKNGLYALSGDSDAGSAISAYIETPEDDFGISNLKTISDIILGVVSDGVVKVKTSRDGVYSREYQVTTTGDKIRNRRIATDKGYRNSNWSIKVYNSNGSDFKLSFIEPSIFVHKRKLRE